MEGIQWAAAGAVVGAALAGACKQHAPASPPTPPPAKRFQWESGAKGRSPNERRALFRDFVQGFQNDITQTLGEMDGQAKFEEDAWTKENGAGQGRTRVISGGRIFESGGCNWSEVYGDRLPPSIIKKHPHLQGKRFYATGVSMVLHPRNPHCPTVHLNYRFFEAGDLDSDDMEQGNVWWFGGGMDLTPWILYAEDAELFHQKIKDACDGYGDHVYPSLKRFVFIRL